MTQLYSILKTSKLGTGAAPDMYTALLAQKINKGGSGGEAELSGVPPLTFRSNGTPLLDYLISGNTTQSGTPTPDNPIMPQGTGDLETVGAKAGQYKIPISSASTTTPVYLGEVETTRKVKKLVLTGEESWRKNDASPNSSLYYLSQLTDKEQADCICTHFQQSNTTYPANNQISAKAEAGIIYIYLSKAIIGTMPSGNTKEGFKEYLAAQYAAGTPVTVWYVLKTPTTGIVNEPLMKIGDYADTLSMEQAGVSIPTNNGSTTVDVDTTVKPSEVYIKYHTR